MTRLGIIGIGEQTRRAHLPCIRYAQRMGYDVEIVAVADFAARLTDLDDFSRQMTHSAQPIKIEGRCGGGFDLAEARAVVSEMKRAGVSAVILATEPMVHGVYLRSLEGAALPYHVDKPFLCARNISVDPSAAVLAIDDLRWLARRYRAAQPAARLGSVNVSRRFDPTLRAAKDEIERAHRGSGQPVTHLDYMYADGEVRDVSGCLDQQQHPFKYGYGALNHSAYHAFDTAIWLCGFDTAFDDLVDVRVQSLARTVGDYLGPSAERAGAEQAGAEGAGAVSAVEYDCAVNAVLRFASGTSTLLSVSVVHDSPTNRSWEHAATRDQLLHLGRLSDELVSISQGESQRLLIRHQELPGLPADGAGAGLPARRIFADVARNPLFASAINRPTYEVLANEAIDVRSLGSSGKWRSFHNFLRKVRNEPYSPDIDLASQLLSQLILLLAARSVAQQGAVQRWTDGRLVTGP